MSAVAWTQWEVLPGGLFVFYGGKGRFSDQAYDQWFGDLTSSGISLYLGGTAKGFQITGAQRNAGRNFFLDNQICFATVTDDPIVRGFVTAAGWFGINIAAFSWDALDKATSSLGLTADLAERAQATLLRLRAAVECKVPAVPVTRSR